MAKDMHHSLHRCSKSHKQLCAKSGERVQGERSNSTAVVLPMTGCCLTENGHTHSSWQRSKESTTIFILGRTGVCKLFSEQEREENSYQSMSPTKLLTYLFPFKTTWLCRTAPTEGQGSGMTWTVASTESTTESRPEGLAGHTILVDRQCLQTQQPRALHTGSRASDSSVLTRVSWILWPV